MSINSIIKPSKRFLKEALLDEDLVRRTKLNKKIDNEIEVKNQKETPTTGSLKKSMLSSADKKTDLDKVDIPTGKERGFKAKDFLKPGAAALGTTAGVVGGLSMLDDDKEEEPVTPVVKKEEEEKKPAPQVTTKEKTTSKETKPQEFDIARIILPQSAEEAELARQMTKNMKTLEAIKDPGMTSPDLRQDMIKDLKKIRQDREKTLQWAQLAERFVAAAAKYAAARDGLNRNLNMSDVEVERTDWNKLIDRAYDNYKTDYEDMITGFDKEDKAKALTDEQRKELATTKDSIRLKMQGLKDRRAREQARLDQRRQELLERARQKREERIAKEQAAAERAERGSEGRGLSPQFLEQRKAAEENIRSLINQEKHRKDIKKAIEQDRRYLSPEFRRSLVEEGRGYGPDFSIQEPESAEEKPAPKPAPYGKRVVQDGTTYIWNGVEYVAE